MWKSLQRIVPLLSVRQRFFCTALITTKPPQSHHKATTEKQVTRYNTCRQIWLKPSNFAAHNVLYGNLFWVLFTISASWSFELYHYLKYHLSCGKPKGTLTTKPLHWLALNRPWLVWQQAVILLVCISRPNDTFLHIRPCHSFIPVLSCISVAKPDIL